jgi:long-chain fatty acid transport protein
MRHVTRCLTLTLAGCLSSDFALANPEPPFLSDGRSNAMGGVGVATNDYASAPYHNPAGLASIESFGLTVTAMPVFAELEGPFPNLATGQPEQHESEPIFAPLGAVGAGYRVHEKVVVGLAAFVPSAFGANYKGAALGRDASAHAFAAEFQLPAAVALTEDLSVGAAYRVTFARLSLEVPDVLPPLTIVDSETTMTGFDFTGFSVGARYRVSEAVRIGVAYRNKVVVDVDGERTYSNGAPPSEQSSEFPLPHTFKVGTEFRLLDQKLTLAVDGAYWVYSDSHDESPENMRARAWDDSIGGSLGIEYWVSEQIPARGGFTLSSSATNAGSAMPFGIPPGLIWAVTAGTGIKLGSVDLDAAVAYQAYAGETVSAADNPTGAGDYSGRAIIATLSGNFRF